MSGPTGKPSTPYERAHAARVAQRKTLDIARVLYPGASLKLARNNRGKVQLDGIQRDACMLVQRDGDRLVALLFASSWAKLYALVVSARKEKAQQQQPDETPCQ